MLPRTAVDHYRRQQGIAAEAVREVDRAWSTMTDDFDGSWAAIAAPVYETTVAAQIAAASTGASYVGALLAETDVNAPPVAALDPRGFAGMAPPDGGELATLLDGSIVQAKQGVRSGLTAGAALHEARGWLQGVVLDSVRFANRQSVSASIAVRPAVTGWVRMMNPPSCKFCITLAGKWFRWNQGFQSHPGCDCRHIPAQESAANDLTVDPYAYFHSLDEKAQNRLFGRNDAQAIREGGDIYRVVNVRGRGLSTSTQARKFGAPSRMTVDDIFAKAKSRNEAVALLSREGYVTGPQRAGGNILGNDPTDARIIAAGRGRGTYLVGSERVTTARAARYDAVTSGQRDPLNRATMTAGERRVYDDFYRAEQALLGRRARTIGGNSADRGTVFDAISAEEADALAMTFLRRIERVRRSGTAQEKRMAELLWARYSSLL
jgi:hypothetical protein